MTEFITRNYGNKDFEIIIKTDSKDHYKATEDFARRLIDHAKPVTGNNAVEVVNCGSCRHADSETADGWLWCNEWQCGSTCDGYCHKGERKDNGTSKI